MTQDWSMIPLHIRCTRRKDIDPTYPDDDAKWWKLTEEVAEHMGRSRMREPYSGVPRSVIEYARTIRGDRAAFVALAGACKISVRDLDAGIRALKRNRPREEAQPVGMTEGEIRRDPWLMKGGV